MIIFIYGQDTYRSRRKLSEIKEKFLREIDPAGLNLIKLNGEKLDLETFVKTAFAPAFLAAKRMIIIEGIFPSAKNKIFRDKLFELLLERKEKKDDNIFIFYEEALGKKDSRDKFFLWLAEQRYAQEFSPLSNIELEKWLKKEAAVQGATIEEKAVDLLISFVGNDLWQLANELNKLIAYKAIEKEKKIIIPLGIIINEEDVKLLVKGKINDDIFALTDALGRKDKRLALQMLHGQLAGGTHPSQLLAMMIWQFRILFMAKDLLSTQPQARLSSRLGVHPYVAQKASLASRNYNLSELKNIYGQLLALDAKIKTGIDPVLSLDLFIAEI